MLGMHSRDDLSELDTAGTNTTMEAHLVGAVRIVFEGMVGDA
jgi:hypothetical protein